MGQNSAQGAVCIDESNFSIATLVLSWQLSRRTKSVSQLGLSSAKFAEDLRNRATFDATGQKGVQRFCSCCDLDNAPTLLEQLHSGNKGRVLQIKEEASGKGRSVLGKIDH